MSGLDDLDDRQLRFLVELVSRQLAVHQGAGRNGVGLAEWQERAIRGLLAEVRDGPGHQTVTKMDVRPRPDEDSWCSTKEACRRTGKSRWGIRKAIRRGEIEARQAMAGSRFEISEASLSRWSASKTPAGEDDRPHGAPVRPSVATDRGRDREG